METIVPDWPAPTQVKALTTTRTGGVSLSPYQSLNLGSHVGDEVLHVQQNRQIMVQHTQLPAEPGWLRQVHGVNVIKLPATNLPAADAAWTDVPKQVCAVLTADCLPVVFCDKSGQRVGVAHAGWRGLAAGVLEATVNAMTQAPDTLLAWLGPAIGPTAFEVGPDVYKAFTEQYTADTDAFRANRPGHWLADLYELARRRLVRCGVTDISGGNHCTYHNTTQFFSYRRDGVTGRMATLVWIA